MISASVAATNDCIIVTDNERDFEGLEFLTRCGVASSRVVAAKYSGTPSASLDFQPRQLRRQGAAGSQPPSDIEDHARPLHP